MIKSNPIPAEWVTHKLENNTKEVLTLLRRLQAPDKAPQPEDPAKALGIPGESDFKGQWDLIKELLQDQGKQKLLEDTNKICAHQDPGERSSDPTGD